MKKKLLGFLINLIALASGAKLYWSQYDPLSNFHGTRREYTPFEKRLYGISGTADRDCGGEMKMCYEVQGKVKKICAIDALGAVVEFPNMCEMLYSNCIMDKENWRYADEKKCIMLSRRFFRYDYENPSMLETTTISPYRAEMVKNMSQFSGNRPNNYRYPGIQYPQNAGNNGYPRNSGNPLYLSNGLSNAALARMQASQQNQGTASQLPAMPSGYPYSQLYSPPIPPAHRGQNMLPPSPNVPYQFPSNYLPPIPKDFIPQNNLDAVPPAFIPTMPSSLDPNGPPNFVPQMPLGYVPRQSMNFFPPKPAGFNPRWPPGYAPQKLGYDPKMSLGFNQPMESGSLPQQSAGNDQSMRRNNKQTNIDKPSQTNSNNTFLRQDFYGFPQLEMLLRMMSHYNNMTARESIRKLIELSLWNSNETVSVELQDQMTYELEKAYNNSDYKDVHKYLPLFNAPKIKSQHTARRDNEVNSVTPPSTNESGPRKYSYKMNANEKEVYDQGVEKPENDNNDTFVPEIQVPNEYGDLEELVDDLDIGF